MVYLMIDEEMTLGVVMAEIVLGILIWSLKKEMERYEEQVY